jgi:serine/threonine-protein phosphatase 6 regulatory ankyrin repeat subunit A
MKVQLRELIARRSNPLGDASDTASDIYSPFILATTELGDSDTVHTAGASLLAPSSSTTTTDFALYSGSRGDAASIMSNSSSLSKRSMRSIRSVRAMIPSLQDALKNSRAYRRLYHRGGLDNSDSQSLSGFSIESREKGCSWSMLSDLSLGDLSLSNIAVIELPIYMTDLYDPRPYVLIAKQVDVHSPGSSTNFKLKWSSRGRIHNAISEGNIFVIRALLSIGSDIEERDRKAQTPLIHAVRREHEVILKVLLEKGANLEAQDADGWTPLHHAVCRDGEDIVILLLEKGVNLETPDAEGLTPLAHAVLKNHEHLVKLLLEKGASSHSLTDLGTMRDLKGLIHDAIEVGNENVVRLLLAIAVDVEERDIQGQTPLLHAVRRNREAIFKMFLEKGVNLEAKDAEGLTPLAHAVLNNNELLVKLLVEHGANTDDLYLNDLDLQRDLKSGVHNAIATGNLKLVRLLLALSVDVEERDTQGQTPLLHAVRRDNEAIVRLLLEKGVNLETPDAEGLTPLAHAVLKNHEHLVELLLEKGASSDSLTDLGTTRDLKGPIHDAIEIGNENVVRLLLAIAVDVEERDIQGQTPLLHAVRRNREAIFKMFLEEGVNVEAEDADGLTPLAHAVLENNEILVKSLLEKGAKVDVLRDIGAKRGFRGRIYDAIDKENENVVRLLLVMGVDIEERDLFRNTPLVLACWFGKSAIAKLLVEQGADMKACDGQGWTVLHCAVLGQNASLLTFLLDNGALEVIDVTRNDGDTPLHVAGFPDTRLPLAQILVERGARLDIKNNNGQTPYEYAISERAFKVAKYLWSQLEPNEQAQLTPPPN